MNCAGCFLHKSYQDEYCYCLFEAEFDENADYHEFACDHMGTSTTYKPDLKCPIKKVIEEVVTEFNEMLFIPKKVKNNDYNQALSDFRNLFDKLANQYL